MRCSEGYDKVVALGNFPSRALDMISISHFKLPHPSGLNRLLNNKQYELGELDACAKYIYDS
jgi:hypothetical protein